MDFSTTTEQNFFKVFVRGWAVLYDEMVRESDQYFREQLALGRSPQDIVNEMRVSLNNGQGLFKSWLGKVGGRIDQGGSTLFQLASNAPMEKVDKMMEWALDPMAEHCDSCLAQAALGPRPFSEIPWPGSQPDAGKTNCTIYCRCQIIPSGK